MFSNFIGKICISDHAMSAQEEFILLESEFEKMINNKEIIPTIDFTKEDYMELLKE